MKSTRIHNKVRWITETAILLALLLAFQLTNLGNQIVTGSCVNCVLAIATIFSGIWSGLVIALVSPVLATWVFHIAPEVTAPAIMVGNSVLVILLHFLSGKALWRNILAWLAAAVAKFAALYAIVAGIICGLAADSLLEAGLLKVPMLKMLPVTFSWPQLVTALIGGGIAMLLVPALRKALKR